MCKANAQQRRSWWGSCRGKLLLLVLLHGTSVISSLVGHKHDNHLSRGSLLLDVKLDERSDAML